MNNASALATITQKLKALERAGSYRDFQAYITSDEYRHLLMALSRSGFMKASSAMVNTQKRMLPEAPVPKRWSMRVRWTPERIAALKAADAKYGSDEANARALGIPYQNAKRARLRYLGNRSSDHLMAA